MDAIGNFLLLDSTDAELGDYLDAGGKHAYHYRPFTDSAVAGAGSSPWRPQVTVSGLRPSVQWPHKVLQRVQVLQSGYRMGLLPEVHRAWAALPSSGGATRGLSLVFWDYEGSLGGESCPLFSEPGCGQVLTLPLSGGEGWAGQVCSLSLVVPKADSIGRTADGTLVRYILVLALPDEVQLFTVAFEGDSVHGGMQVFGYKGERVGCFRSGSSGAPLASLSTDGVRFDSVAGTQHGRIFLGGSDGCVHELVLAGAAAAGGVRRGLAGGISVAVGEVVAGAATYVKRRALSALALGGRVDPSLSASLINHGVGMLHTLLSAVLGSTPVAGYPIVDLAINHERGIMAALSLDGRLALWNVGPAGDECVPVAVVADLDAAALDFCATGDASNKPRSELFTRGQGRSRLEKEGLVPGPALPGLATLLELPSLRMPPAVWPAVSVAFLPSSDSARVHLVVTAASGARLYFTTLSAERYKELGRGGAPPEVAGALPSPSAAPGLGLSLVYIRLPPPFTTVASYRMGEAAALPSARPDGFEPVPSPVGLVPRGGVAVSGRHALMGLQGGAGGGAETDAERDARPGSVLVCSRDYLRRREAGTGDEADREAAGWCRLPYAESVCSVEVNGCPLAIAAEQADPSLAWDPVFTPVGAMCLPEGETAPLPPRAWEVRCGLGLEAGLSGPPPHTASVASLAETRAGNKRPRPDDASELSLAPLAGSIVAQEGLTEGGVPLAAGQLVRRRLWDAAPGWGTAGTLFSTQLEARASAATWLVLTVRGVTRLSHVRPIDQASAMLCKLDLTASALSGPGPSPTLAMHDPALDALLGWMPLPEEAFALIAAIACGVLTPALQGVSPVPTLATRPCTAHILHLADGADKAGRAAGEVLKLYKTPAWDPSSRTHSKHDLRFSPAVAGLLLYSARLLRPVWDRTLFIAPPATTDTRMGGAGLVRVGAKRVAGAREGGGVAPGVPVAAGVLLPRFTAAECVLLSRRLAAVAATLRSLHPSWVESFREGVPPAMAASVRELGLEAEFGLEEEGRGGVALGGGLGESRAEPSAKELVRRAWSLEGLYVALTWRLVSKAREGADFMAAVADPAFGGASVLWAAGGAAEGINIKGKPVPAPSTAVPAQAGAVSDAELRTLAKATRWVDLLSLSSGAALADALANRMIAVLRARAEAEGSAGKGAAVGTPARAAPAPRSTPLSFSALSESSIGGGPRLSASLIGGGTARAGAGDEADALARHLQERCPSFFSVGNRLKVAAASAAEAAARTSNAGQRAELLRESAENARGAVRSWGSGASGPTSLVANLGSVQALAERWTALGAPAAACAVLADVAEGIAGGRAGIAVLPEDAPPALSASLTPSTEARMRSYTAIVGVLAGVMAAGGEGWRGLLNDVLTRPDALLHDTVYRWLERAPAGPGSVLPRTVLLSLTTSEYLPLYLTRRSEGPELLVQFYEARGEYGRAALHLRSLVDSRLPSSSASPSDALPISTRVAYMSQALALGTMSAGQVSRPHAFGASSVGAAADPSAITPADLSLWERYNRLLRAQETLARGLARQVAAQGGPSCEDASLVSTLQVAERDLLELQAVYEVADAHRLLDVIVAVLDVDRSPATQPRLSALYTVMLGGVISAVDAGSLSALSFTSTQGVRSALRLPPGATAVPAAYRTIEGVLRALAVVVHDLVATFHPDAAAPAWAFPTSHVVSLLEENCAVKGWAEEAGREFDPAWLSVNALAGIDWAERHAAYRALWERARAGASTRRLAVLTHTARAWAALVRAWGASAGRERRAGRGLEEELRPFERAVRECLGEEARAASRAGDAQGAASAEAVVRELGEMAGHLVAGGAGGASRIGPVGANSTLSMSLLR